MAQVQTFNLVQKIDHNMNQVIGHGIRWADDSVSLWMLTPGYANEYAADTPMHFPDGMAAIDHLYSRTDVSAPWNG